MPIPKDKLNKIFSDPEFLELGDSEKESLLSAIEASEKTITGSNNTPEKKITPNSTSPNIPTIDIIGALRQGTRSALMPSPMQMSQGGMDIAQRFGQEALGNLYGQGRQAIQGMASPQIKQQLGQGISSVLPGGQMLSPKIQQEIGNQGVGAMVDVGAGLATSGALKIGSMTKNIKLPDVMELLTSTKSLKNVAIQANRSLNRARNTFSNSYTELMDKVGDKPIPNDLKQILGTKVSDASQQTAPGSAINKYMSDDLFNTLNSENINMRDLHALKGKIFKQAKSAIGVEKNALMQVYDEINKTLSHKSLGGTQYSNLTSEYESFLRNEVGYIDKLIKDTQKNVTEAKLGKRGMLGLGRPANLSSNQREAFKRLSNRKTSTMDLMGSLDEIRRREMLVRGGLAIGASLLPGARSLGRTTQYIAERS